MTDAATTIQKGRFRVRGNNTCANGYVFMPHWGYSHWARGAVTMRVEQPVNRAVLLLDQYDVLPR